MQILRLFHLRGMELKRDTDIAQKFILLDKIMKLSLTVLFIKPFQEQSVEGALGYRKTNFFTISASHNFGSQ